jgi:uncharacterized protein
MRILVTGATGFVGGRLCELLRSEGHQVVALTRDTSAAKSRLPTLEAAHFWHARSGPPPREAFDGVDGVVNLVGEPVVGRWTEAKRQAIRDSRVIGTENLVEGIVKASPPPKILVSASAIGFYGDRGDEELTEDSKPGDDFLADTCQRWEAAANLARVHGVAVVTPRIGIVVGPGGGALQAMLTPFKLGAGGPLGSGKQWWSWIHRDDLAGLILFLLGRSYDGVVNATAPNPLRQKDFARVLGAVLHRPAFMPAPAFALKIVLGEFSSELLSSKRVLPKNTLAAGYRFQYPDLRPALEQALV